MIPGLFSFLMEESYEDRKVAKFEEDGFFVSTARITDSIEPYETAVSHPFYKEGKLIVVEMYDTKEEALIGHEKWVNELKTLPEFLIDVSTSFTSSLVDATEENADWRKFYKQEITHH